MTPQGSRSNVAKSASSIELGRQYPPWTNKSHPLADAIVLAVVLLLLWTVAGFTGLGISIVIIGLWAAFPNLVAFAVSQPLTVAAQTAGSGTGLLWFAIIASGGLLVTTIPSPYFAQDVVQFGGLWLAVAILIWAVFSATESVWLAAVALLVIVGVGFVSIDVYSLRQTGGEPDE